MGAMFSINSKFMSGLNRIVDIVFLNLIFIVTCIPIFTIGASITALYTVTLKLASHDEIYVVKTYIKSFKLNFKQSTKVWLIEVAAFLIIYIEMRICRDFDFFFKIPVLFILCCLLIVFGISIIFVFPIIAKIDAPLKNIFINSICIPLSNLAAMITVILIQVVPLIMVINSGRLFDLWCYLVIMGWFAFISYMSSFYINKMLSKFISTE